jgi:aspartate/tyrosine/aromatic aminotransferase
MRSQASFTQEIFFQTTELQVERVTRHRNQTYNYIDANGRVAVFDTPRVRLSCPRRRA